MSENSKRKFLFEWNFQNANHSTANSAGRSNETEISYKKFWKIWGLLFDSRNFGAGANTSEIAGKFFMKSKIVDFPNHSIGTVSRENAAHMLHISCTHDVF